jgi:hydrogenase expression/formation protein HypC
MFFAVREKSILRATDVCLILPSRVIALGESVADVELADGQVTTVSTLVTSGVTVGEYVLVDRGFIIQTISVDEAQAILALYDEMNILVEPA